MPKYQLICPECNNEEEVICPVEERNSFVCYCEPNISMKVKITTANFHNRLKFKHKVNEWMKERGF